MFTQLSVNFILFKGETGRHSFQVIRLPSYVIQFPIDNEELWRDCSHSELVFNSLTQNLDISLKTFT